MTWARAAFSDLVETNPRVNLVRGCEYPFVEMGAVVPGRRYVHAQSTRQYSSGGAKFQIGDTLFAHITPCLENGKIAQFAGGDGTTGFGSTEFFVFRHRRGVSDPAFVYYLSISDVVRKPAEASMRGASGRQRAELAAVRDLELEVPPLPVQRKIAAILSAYDDLIENNMQRLEFLEELARLLYREWFVAFRFPGHESVAMVASALGPIPERWELKKATDAILINPSTRVPREGGKPFVPMSSLRSNSMLIDNVETRSGNAGAKFRNGDTLFARITPCLENGKTGYVQFLSPEGHGFGSTEFIVLRPKTLSPQLVYLLARSDEFRDNAIKSMSGASGRQRVRDSCFDKFLFAHPPAEVVRAFSDNVSPLFDAIHLLGVKNANLRRTRDLLLPKLISGELNVEDFDIEVGELRE